MAKNPTRKTIKLHLGWLYRSHGQSRYKQVRIKDGGGVCELTCPEDQDITVDYLKIKASQIFFPEGVSKYGDLSEMSLELGNFAQNSISAFKDTMGEECTFQEYLKSHGLFASKSPIYLMSTSTEEKESSIEKVPSSSPIAISSDGDEGGSGIKNVFMGCSRSELAGEFESLQMTSTQNRDMSFEQSTKTPQAPLFGLALNEDEGTLCTTENADAHRPMISYETYTESSYSAEVVLTTVSFSRKDCYDVKCVLEPLLQDIDIEEFDPLEHGFTVANISKGQKCFLDVHVEPPDAQYSQPPGESLGETSLQLEAAKSDRLIIYPPLEVWGYDANCLILGVVASCHTAVSALYVWYRNGIPYKKGNKLCCLAIKEPGLYTVEVQYEEKIDVSEQVYIRSFSDEKKMRKDREEFVAPKPLNESVLPIVEKEEISFSSKDEIGRGAFGVVYKGEWAGTEVAVKQIKLRNAKRIRPVLETEVKVHSMVRHPNIVQIMAVSFLKNSILLVSELINDRNLEDLLFADPDDDETFTIQACDKLLVGKQICQAVAYLHNLKPPIVHRDIKPANVIVAKATHTTKLSDMGLRKLKSAQSLSQTQTTSVPGTPSYMAPECLVAKKKATIHSDVWSLACTLIELFTEKDCWEDLLENKESSQEQGDDNVAIVNTLVNLMKAEAFPSSLQSLPSTLEASFGQLLKDCLQHKSEKRPGAVDLVHAFTRQLLGDEKKKGSEA